MLTQTFISRARLAISLVAVSLALYAPASHAATLGEGSSMIVSVHVSADCTVAAAAEVQNAAINCSMPSTYQTNVVPGSLTVSAADEQVLVPSADGVTMTVTY